MTATKAPVERYAIITRLAEYYNDRGLVFGKTVLQKLVYFLQEVHGVDCGYEYRLYTYGPFSADLLTDLDSAAAEQSVSVVYDSSLGGYDIKPGPKKEAIYDRSRASLETADPELQILVSHFSSYTARNLELRATIIYVDHEAMSAGKQFSKEELVRAVQGLKPHFEETIVQTAFEDLHNKGYISQGGQSHLPTPLGK